MCLLKFVWMIGCWMIACWMIKTRFKNGKSMMLNWYWNWDCSAATFLKSDDTYYYYYNSNENGNCNNNNNNCRRKSTRGSRTGKC